MFIVNFLSIMPFSSYLTVLLQESKLSILQQKKIQSSVRNGDPLPPLSSGQSIKSSVRASTSANVEKRVFHKKRTRDAIISSGAYDRDPFVSLHPKGTTSTFFCI
jgi:hypothetical protein